MQFIESILVILNQMSPYILLGFLIAGLLHVFVKPSLMSRHLAGNGLGPVVKAALFGIPLPLCSCGVLPTAVSLRRNGASNAATTSFLIATPQTGMDSVAATYSLLGLPMAVMRPVAALVCAMLGGVTVGRFAKNHTDDAIDNSVHHDDCGDDCHCRVDADRQSPSTFMGKLIAAMHYGLVDMIQHVGKWLVIGLVIAALITVFVPDNLFVELSEYPLLAMLAMVAVAVPMYICATGSIPIALTLMMKGLSPGVAFVMLMAGPAANFASVMVLRRSIGARATAIYVASVVVTAIGFGLAIDYLMPAHWFAVSGGFNAACHHGVTFGLFDSLCSLLLIGLLINAYIKNRTENKTKLQNTMTKNSFKIKGMMCPHCQATVRQGIETLTGVIAVTVHLNDGIAEVEGDLDPAEVIAKVHSLGYEAQMLD